MDIFETYPRLLDETFILTYDFANCYTVAEDGPIGELDAAVALIAFRGNLTNVAKQLVRSRRVVETFVNRNPMLSDLQQDLEENFLDEIEEKYRNLAQSGDANAIRYFLTTKGKHRGFTTRNELTGKDGNPIQVEEVSTEELIDEAKRLGIPLEAFGISDPEKEG